MKKFIFCLLILLSLSACGKNPALTPQSKSTVPESTQTISLDGSQTITVTPSDTPSHQPNQKIIIAEQLNAKYYLTNPDGSEHILLYDNADNQLQMPALSPDATKFAYFLNNVVYILDINTGKTITLTKEDIGPAGGDRIRWSPDSAKLALSCSIKGQGTSAICLIDAQTGKIEILLNEKNLDAYCASHFATLMDWSQDGSTLVYNCYRVLEQGQKPEYSIYFYDFASKTSRKIFGGTTQSVFWGSPSVSISPDNRFLLLSTDQEDHVLQIFLLDLSNNTFKQLTHETNYDSSADVWLNDSRHFFLNKTSRQAPYSQSNFIMNINGEIESSLKIEGTIIK